MVVSFPRDEAFFCEKKAVWEDKSEGTFPGVTVIIRDTGCGYGGLKLNYLNECDMNVVSM